MVPSRPATSSHDRRLLTPDSNFVSGVHCQRVTSIMVDHTDATTIGTRRADKTLLLIGVCCNRLHTHLSYNFCRFGDIGSPCKPYTGRHIFQKNNFAFKPWRPKFKSFTSGRIHRRIPIRTRSSGAPGGLEWPRNCDQCASVGC